MTNGSVFESCTVPVSDVDGVKGPFMKAKLYLTLLRRPKLLNMAFVALNIMSHTLKVPPCRLVTVHVADTLATSVLAKKPSIGILRSPDSQGIAPQLQRNV